MKLAKLFIIFFAVSIFLMAGCTEKQCKTRLDCPAKGSCFITSCVKNECQYREKPGCTCGNLRCEDGVKDPRDLGENPCNCKEDCGKCEGKIGDFMERECVEQECISQIIGQKEVPIEAEMKYEESRQTKLQLSLKATFDDPFNVNKSLMKVSISIDKMIADVSDVKITKLKIIEHTGKKDRFGRWVDDDPIPITERTYSKILFDETSIFQKEFPIIINGLNPEKAEKKIMGLIVGYELKLPDRYGNIADKQATFEKEVEMTFVSPKAKVSCPTSCDDDNDCTRDYCNTLTNFFCEHDIIVSRVACCGDDVCSPGEDRCKCEDDCGQCIGDLGDYMMMGCNIRNKCTSQIKDKSIIKPTSKLADIDFSDASMSLKIVYDSPFNKEESIFKFTFEPKVFTGYRNVVLKKVTLLDESETILGDQILNTPVLEGTTATASAMLSYQTVNAEEKKTVSIRFDYSLEKQNPKSGEWSPVISSQSYSLGDLTILSPE